MDFFKTAQLTFEEPDIVRFRNLQLAYVALERGGNMPCILNAANEVVNRAFLEDRIGFLRMGEIIEATMQKAFFVQSPAYEDYLQTDNEARKIASEML